jgi:hypothetical protein
LTVESYITNQILFSISQTTKKINVMDMFNEMPRFKTSSEFFSTDEDELVNMEFQTSDDQMYTNNNEEVLNVKKKKSSNEFLTF